MRRAISSLCTLDQAEEELRILSDECQRFVNYQCSELNSLESTLHIVFPGSAVHSYVSKCASDVFKSLVGMQRLQKIASFLSESQPTENCFKDLEGKFLNCLIIMTACILKARARSENHCPTDALCSDLLSRRLNLNDLPEGGDEEYMYDQREAGADNW